MQKLIMPFKKQMMLCGYMNSNYRGYWGYSHYGVDISTIQGRAGTDHTIYASGDGIVVGVGKDNSLGWGIAILYKDCYNHKTGKVCDLVARYMHMSEAYVVKGQAVKAGDRLAPEGKEGTGDYHLHIEFDTDTKWPLYTPQVSAGHTFWKKGTNTTVNPSHIFHIGQGQEVVKPTYNPAWLNSEDFSIPKVAVATVAQPQESITTPIKAKKYAVGDIVMFNGGKQYATTNAIIGIKVKPTKAKITGIIGNGKHPYRLSAVNSPGKVVSALSGWVDANTIKRI